MAVGDNRSAPHAEDLFLHPLLEDRIDIPVVEVALVVTHTLNVLAALDLLADAIGLNLGDTVAIAGARRSGNPVHRIELRLDHFVKRCSRTAGSGNHLSFHLRKVCGLRSGLGRSLGRRRRDSRCSSGRLRRGCGLGRSGRRGLSSGSRLSSRCCSLSERHPYERQGQKRNKNMLVHEISHRLKCS